MAKKICKVLYENNCSTNPDMMVIFKLLMGDYYSLCDGRYVYNRKIYDSYDELPDKGKRAFKEQEKLVDKILLASHIPDEMLEKFGGD